MGVVSRKVAGFFYKFGERIAISPKYFIVTPIILTFICALGFLRLEYVNDVTFLYTQTDGRTHFEEQTLNRLFPSKYDGRFDPSRISQFGRFARLIVTTKDENSSVLTTEVWNEILTLDRLLHNVTITWKNETFNYTSLCANWFGTCFENEFLDLKDQIAGNESSKLNYPVAFNPKTLKAHLLPLFLGGVTRTEDNFYMDSAKAILLNYVIAVDSPEDSERGKVWEHAVIDSLKKHESTWNATKVRGMVFEAWAEEVDNGMFSVVPHFVVTTVLMGVFTVVTSMMNDWVKSKPWLGVMGSISALLGTIAGGGIVCVLGVPFVGLNMAIPFLMLGIGIDDTFVMLASWRRTSSADPVPKRLAECYSDAAMSVTITTLTDMTSFYIGALTTIPSIQIFSYYAGTCILCIYIYQLCFFGGFMAISGYLEAENKHSLFWWMQAVPKSKAKGKEISKWKRMLMIGGIDKGDPSNAEDNNDNAVMVFFRDSFSTFIFRPGVKIIVLVAFIVYIGISIWGITIMDEGIRLERTVRYDSFVADFLVTEQKYFRHFAHRIQVVVDTPLDYSQKEAQDKISNLLQEFYNLDQISELWSENWLRDFLRFSENYREFYNFNISTEQDFIHTLRENYLNEKFPISSDILFNENKTEILATRYIIQSQNIGNIHLETDMVLKLRDICAKAENDGLKVSIYFPWFHFVDQVIIIGEVTTKLVAVAAVIVMTVAIVLIPNLVCAISVLFSIVSIEIGILGFMSLWGVSLDLTSVLCVIMCIGFSVDFSAHISYAFITSKADYTEDKMRDAMFSLGLPVVQGAISTIIGIAALMFANSYIYQVFFKVGVLVIAFALWHSLFLLPVLLLLLKPDKGYNCKSKTFFVDNSFALNTNVSKTSI